VENKPVITLTSYSPAPAADAELYERYQKWSLEVYVPLNLKIPEILGLDYYKIIRETPEYPLITGVIHFNNIVDWSAYTPNSIGNALMKDIRGWDERGVSERIWYPAYALIRSFRNNPSPPAYGKSLIVDNAPIISLEAYRTAAVQDEQYYKWFNDYGCNLLMPLIMKLPGVAAYGWYEDTGRRRWPDTRETEYPKYLSIIYFENVDSYENYAGSSELAALRKSLRSVFPRGLNFKWYVQYRLVTSCRR
jgi:hypothetical protein